MRLGNIASHFSNLAQEEIEKVLLIVRIDRGRGRLFFEDGTCQMKLSARLILLLTFSVSVVMVVASLITLRQREAALLDAARNEARVHAVTLQIALEEDYLTGRWLDAQRLINRLRENTGVYSAALFDEAGEIVAISNTLAL